MTSELDLVSLEASLGPPAQYSAASYTAGTMLHHLQELVQHAESKGWELANGGNMATIATDIIISLYSVYK
jgi:hypothetical protein